MPVPAGTQLGRYTVLKSLVKGGERPTDVLLARAAGMGGFAHHVVIKAIRETKTSDPAFVKAFVDEARLSASLHHSHIVQVHDVGREGDIYFFAMEYLHGENLRALLAKLARESGFVPLDQVITIALAVAAGLHYAHQQSIVHRDVTPANILVGYDGNVKVTDFGIAKALLRSNDATKSGTMRGKVAYMAPEQCLGRPVDRRADIFSLGIVLYELVTSRRLFKGDTDFLVMTSIVNGKIPKPTLHRPDLPLELEDIILKALAPKPELRFATAEELGLALEQAAITNQIRISTTALGEYLRQQFGTREEPWLVEAKLDSVDVDFDGAGAGLATIAPGRELLPADDDLDAFADDGATQIQVPDLDDEPPTLVPPTATSGFEVNERTLLGDREDVDMLLHLSRIAPHPQAPAPPPATPSAARIERSQPLPPMPAPLQTWGTSPSGTGTPMAWASDADVPSLRPSSRRPLLVAAIVLPLVVLGIALLARGGDAPQRARVVEPDAFVPLDAPVPDAALPDAAAAKPKPKPSKR